MNGPWFGIARVAPDYRTIAAFRQDNPEAIIAAGAAFITCFTPCPRRSWEVPEADQLQVLTDGGYSNAEEVACCERENIEVAAPIKRGAMSIEHFRPVQFIYDEDNDTIRCPGGQTLKPSGIHTRNRAIRYRTPACPATHSPDLTRTVMPTFARGTGKMVQFRPVIRLARSTRLPPPPQCDLSMPHGRAILARSHRHHTPPRPADRRWLRWCQHLRPDWQR